ncbi:MAG TPA: FAD-binding oxidoreductase, partial [Thermomicrobiales bacterium]|nr:FAD-binding oxidoreductase [Thermomicrobiales bacterium]
MANSSTTTTLIIGAGAIGCAIALELGRRGQRDVLLVDRGRAGSGSSGRAAGGLRAQYSTEFTIRSTQLSQQMFREAEAELGGSIGYDEAGYIILARTAEQADAFRQNVALQQSLGVDVSLLSPDDLERGWPWIQPDGIHVAAWCPTDAIFDQVRFMDLLAARVRDQGIAIREGVTVTRLLRDGERVIGVETDRGPIHAGTTILATGVWSPLLSATVGLDLPVTPRRRAIYLTPQVGGLPERMPFVADFDRGEYIRRDGDLIRISGGIAGDDPWDDSFDLARGEADIAWVGELFPALAGAPLTGGWAGLVELTPDHHPLLGAVPGYDGLVVATGFSGHGVMHAPVTGTLIAELLLDSQATTLDITPLAPLRFAEG